MRSRRVVRAALGVALGLLLTVAAGAGTLAQDRPLTIPKQLNGMPLTHESVKAALRQVNFSRAAVDKLDMYSVRLSGNLLAATLEVAHFKAGNDVGSLAFQQDVARQIGSTTAQGLEVSGQFVFLTTARGIDIAIWFRGSNVLILVIRTDYAHPKDLLRSAVESLR